MNRKKSKFIGNRHERGLTSIELIIGMAGALVVVSALALPLSRYFLKAASYQMKTSNTITMLKLCDEIKQAKQVVACSSTSVTLRDVENNSFQFAYDPKGRTLSRIDDSGTNVYLKNCDFFEFRTYQPMTISNRFDAEHIPAFATGARVVEVIWHCTDRFKGTDIKIEDGQSARATIRNQR
jgi:hypothetical protein